MSLKDIAARHARLGLRAEQEMDDDRKSRDDLIHRLYEVRNGFPMPARNYYGTNTQQAHADRGELLEFARKLAMVAPFGNDPCVCAFCGAPWDGGEEDIPHASDCIWLQAQALRGGLQRGVIVARCEPNCSKGQAIRQFLRGRRGPVSSYVILDDGPGELEGLDLRRWIKTDGAVGFTEQDAKQARALLNTEAK